MSYLRRNWFGAGMEHRWFHLIWNTDDFFGKEKCHLNWISKTFSWWPCRCWWSKLGRNDFSTRNSQHRRREHPRARQIQRQRQLDRDSGWRQEDTDIQADGQICPWRPAEEYESGTVWDKYGKYPRGSGLAGTSRLSPKIFPYCVPESPLLAGIWETAHRDSCSHGYNYIPANKYLGVESA